MGSKLGHHFNKHRVRQSSVKERVGQEANVPEFGSDGEWWRNTKEPMSRLRSGYKSAKRR